MKLLRNLATVLLLSTASAEEASARAPAERSVGSKVFSTKYIAKKILGTSKFSNTASVSLWTTTLLDFGYFGTNFLDQTLFFGKDCPTTLSLDAAHPPNVVGTLNLTYPGCTPEKGTTDQQKAVADFIFAFNSQLSCVNSPPGLKKALKKKNILSTCIGREGFLFDVVTTNGADADAMATMATQAMTMGQPMDGDVLALLESLYPELFDEATSEAKAAAVQSTEVFLTFPSPNSNGQLAYTVAAGVALPPVTASFTANFLVFGVRFTDPQGSLPNRFCPDAFPIEIRTLITGILVQCVGLYLGAVSSTAAIGY